ncbi:type III-B CRISPR module RAMP protein Cmr6 [filamentous cyanobacterium CCP5]|nr:type III-B CRISPR module RAMP protein Cmr6 [filamentous cyanobacterium CCP5]
MVFERPPKPGQAKPNHATQRPNTPNQKKKKVITTGGNRGDRGGNRGGSNNRNRRNDEPLPPEASPWLVEPEFEPDSSASFVEYLRWMRSPDSPYKDPTKVQILQMAEENADYRDRLKQQNNRTKLIVGEANCFEVTCPWRIRVGGHRGPESILLPAFDALGMPYIPSSTLRGVARTQAIREKLPANFDYSDKEAVKQAWKNADRQVAEWFGHLDADERDRTGKVVFLDAYPVANANRPGGGLSVDMANNIWSWKDGKPDYNPNPNPYFSLQESRFLIGVRRTSACSQEKLNQVKQWLIKGLKSGIGSQVNSGYGSLLNEDLSESPFFQIDFTLQGQLIHGHQRFTDVYDPYQRDRDGQFKRDKSNKLKSGARSVSEMRPVAFKSMLRYWFRTFSLGVMQSEDIKSFEAKLFGSIDPQTHGWVRVTLSNIREIRPEAKRKQDDYGEYSGTLNLIYSPEVQVENQNAISDLIKHLTWLMFHLGGVGQGARRPCYSRQSRQFAPWWRGSTLIAETNDEFWRLPGTAQAFKLLFCRHLKSFYDSLGKITGQSLSAQALQTVGQVRQDTWSEAVDRDCRIIVCPESEDFEKPYALAILHSDNFKKTITVRRNGREEEKQVYDGNLCGQVQGKVKPSPIWVSNLGNYQVVIIFGATQNPRKKYLESLEDAVQIFPLT